VAHLAARHLRQGALPGLVWAARPHGLPGLMACPASWPACPVSWLPNLIACPISWDTACPRARLAARPRRGFPTCPSARLAARPLQTCPACSLAWSLNTIMRAGVLASRLWGSAGAQHTAAACMHKRPHHDDHTDFPSSCWCATPVSTPVSYSECCVMCLIRLTLRRARPPLRPR
jgi:hypothetical protein